MKEWSLHRLPLLLLSALLVPACGDDVTVTQSFTERLASVSEMREQVESRVLTLQADCQNGRVGEPYCYNGQTWYTDNVMAAFNGWISRAQSDLTASGGLENLTAYDADLESALRNGELFNSWVDKLHSASVPPQGAFGAPSAGELGEVLIKLGVAVWEQYQAGEQARIEELKQAFDGERFSSYLLVVL
jgi:hypothetical protein